MTIVTLMNISLFWLNLYFGIKKKNKYKSLNIFVAGLLFCSVIRQVINHYIK